MWCSRWYTMVLGDGTGRFSRRHLHAQERLQLYVHILVCLHRLGSVYYVCVCAYTVGSLAKWCSFAFFPVQGSCAQGPFADRWLAVLGYRAQSTTGFFVHACMDACRPACTRANIACSQKQTHTHTHIHIYVCDYV